ncbi:hypothetical protein BKI52_20160 [marine bacterium AO1-C]|nr:hypothetical protein BKI52_20160 [marine bacterium AO1-C]
MNRFMIIGAILLFNTVLGYAQNPELPQKTLSPYFFVKSNTNNTDQMPLKSTSVEVNIAGVIAEVVVNQVYENKGKETLEALYVFPGSINAAVHGMEMQVGKRHIIAQIEEKQKARKRYTKAKKQGKTASLLEQKRPNVFQMNVANILPGDKITVKLRYTELLIPTNGVYEFVYPTVVGPRYSNQPLATATASQKWVQSPYIKRKTSDFTNTTTSQPTYTFDITTTIDAGIPIQKVACTSHRTKVKFRKKGSTKVRLHPKEKLGGNRDFILQYQLLGKRIQSGILLQLGKTPQDENFFLMMMQPPKTPKTAQIPPREYIFVFDVSGSMDGFPLETSKELMKNLLAKLRPQDKFNVLLFEYNNAMLAPQSMAATPQNIQNVLQVFNKQSGSGGTRLLPALRKALSFPNMDDYSRTFVIVTDGYITVEKEAFNLIRDNLNKANLFAFGIGSSVNRYLINGLAKAGLGEPFIVTKPAEAAKQANHFQQYIQSPVLTNIQANFGGMQVYDVEPKSIPDVFASRPILVYGKYKGTPTGNITIEGKTGNKRYSQKMDLEEASLVSGEALKYLWARKKIQWLSDYGKVNPEPQLKKQITNLGLKYSLLTQYTSFIAVDDKIRNKTGKQTQVKQPLPLPKGVSNKAVGKLAPPLPVIKSPNVIEIPDEEEIVDEIEVDLEVELEEEVVPPPPPIVEEKEEEIFMITEKQAEFPGGRANLYKYIQQNLKYPPKARQMAIEGKVYVELIIGKDGSIVSIRVVRGLSKDCDQEAIRVMKKMPKWTPATVRGRRVKQKITVPIVFKLK